MFYNRKQLAFRTAILYSGSQLGNAFGNLLALGIIEMDGTYNAEIILGINLTRFTRHPRNRGLALAVHH